MRTELTDLDRAIHICVRGAVHTRTECLALIRQFYEVISHALQDICPGTETVTQVLLIHNPYNTWVHMSILYTVFPPIVAPAILNFEGNFARKNLSILRK